MKIIRNYDDFEIPIKVYDSNGFIINPQDASTIDISVFTTDISACLVFDKSDIDVFSRKIAVDGHDASIFENGTLYYKYHLVMPAAQYPDGNYTAERLVQTDIYIMNEPEVHKQTCATMVSELINDAGYITRIQAIPLINAQVDERVDYDISTRLDNYATKAYVDLSVNLVRSEIPTIPTKVSAFENDRGYLTAHQSLENYATKADVSSGLNTKQAVLISGTNIKTINGNSILGAGNIDISAGGISPQDLSLYATKQWVENKGYLTQHQDISGKADKSYVDDNFVDNSTFTENNEVVSAAINQLIRNKADKNDISAFITGNDVSVFAKTSDVSTALSGKQATLVSGVNIKTINGQDVLGSGNLVIDGSGTIDLSIYATKGYVDASVQAVRNEIPSLSGYATESWVNSKGYLVSNDISALSTKNYVDNKVNSSLVGYATQQWVGSQNYLKNNDVSTFTTKEYVDGSINQLREEMGDISTYATKQWVEDKHYLINNDISTFVSKEYVDASVQAVRTEIPIVPTVVSAFTNDVGYLTAHQSLENYATKQYVLTETARVEAEIPDVSAFATRNYVDGSINTLKEYVDGSIEQLRNEIPDVSNYATKVYVDSSLSLKQNVLVSGTNIKTINNQSILGSGNIDISGGIVDPSVYATKEYVDSSFLPLTGGIINGNLTIKRDSSTFGKINIGTWFNSMSYDGSLKICSLNDIILSNYSAGVTHNKTYYENESGLKSEIATINDISTNVHSSYISNMWVGTQAKYNSIATKDSSTFYIIKLG